ncbi:ABC transporter ATP-binding protein [Zwartia panacis]|uniref:ABC transporter ATP-binding protein n=1 Tax=Zwartia panacis TaxID=2683345 RepID=UPI0025B2C7E4|nr:ABC transporter ATP-binding protein [Zwartia panacis]MDN4018055.1 ABC transporter ATP-binding protein [Zwartia panacis]
MGSITVAQLGKAYKQYPSRWSRLAEWLIPFSKKRHTLKWVLKDLNFSVSPGEAVGIVGINGAGKSTLLKMITGTTQATTGSVSVSGSVAALLELGMGFHPDFTGRQNAIMAGQLLGYSLEELDRLMPEIESFAEIGDYIDQPVRVYSSGMQMRLAFSVATARRPDILIVDEALSVGDTYFQHKSFDRIRAFNKLGTTLLIVSHDKGAVQGICDRAILLDRGRLAMEGDPEAVMDYYNAMLAEKGNQTVRQELLPDGKVKTISGTGEATIIEAVLVNDQDEMIEIVDVGQSVRIKVKVSISKDIPEVVLGYMIKDRLGQPIFGTNTHHLQQPSQNLKSGENIDFILSFPANLGEGSYSVAVALHTADTHVANNYEWRDRAIVFNVININKDRFVGVAWLPTTLETHR